MPRRRRRRGAAARANDRIGAWERRAEKIYHDPNVVGSLGGVANLARALADKKRKKTREWLSGQDAYTLHRQARKTFPRRPTIVSGPGVQLQADLMDVSSHAERNDGVKFLLTVVDVFSRLAWAVPLRDKSGREVSDALRQTFAGSGYKKLQTDKGTEFRNARVREFLREEGTRWFSSENEVIKASLVERFNRTLRRKIHAYLTRFREGRYIDRLSEMVDAYNRTPHSALDGLAPVDVNSTNAADLFVSMYEPVSSLAREAPKLSSGDHVRTTKHRGAFERGYTEQWTREIFVVDEVRSYESPVVYTLKDLAGEPVIGTYYERELQRVKAPETFIVERVLRSRGRGARRERLVKWLGYPDSFNSWVPDSDFT
jgi:hypothetical protein